MVAFKLAARFNEPAVELSGYQLQPFRFPMSPAGAKPHVNDGLSISALPWGSDVYLFCYCERVIHLYSEVSDGTLDLHRCCRGSVCCSGYSGRVVLKLSFSAFDPCEVLQAALVSGCSPPRTQFGYFS